MGVGGGRIGRLDPSLTSFPPGTGWLGGGPKGHVQTKLTQRGEQELPSYLLEGQHGDSKKEGKFLGVSGRKEQQQTCIKAPHSQSAINPDGYLR